MLAKSTVEKYEKLKQELKLDSFVFCMQSGIFFNIIGKEAKDLSGTLGLKCMEDDGISHIGFPTSALEKYLGRMIMNGMNVAVYGKVRNFSNEEGLIVRVIVENKNGSKDCRAVV